MGIVLSFNNSQILYFGVVFVSVSLWEYILFQRNTTHYPYREGFAIFSLLQWIGVFLGMIGIFGLFWGLGVSVFCLLLLQYVCHFTLGFLWRRIAEVSYLFPTAIFSVNVWVLLAFGIYHFI